MGSAVMRGANLMIRFVYFKLIGIIALLFMITTAQAQDIEPRSYSNAPIGMNFLVAGYVYSEGKMAFDPSVPITNARFHVNNGVLAYAHSLDVWGKTAKFDVILPYGHFSAHGLVDFQDRTREMSGLGDPRFRFSLNIYGAPALSVKEFAAYRQDLIVGVSMQVSAPLGQYDESKLLNLGNNRWSFKPELGISKAWGQWTLELVPSATFYTDNSDFYNGGTFGQAPIYSVQTNIIYSFKSGIWLALGSTYFTGGRTSLNGVKADNEQTSTRAGLTLALPVDRNNSVKLYASTGVTTRTGSEFNSVGIAWQFRWGAGY